MLLHADHRLWRFVPIYIEVIIIIITYEVL